MNEHRSPEDLIDSRAEEWRAARTTYEERFSPVSAVQASRAFEPYPVDVLEDTIPLPAYRPQRLI